MREDIVRRMGYDPARRRAQPDPRHLPAVFADLRAHYIFNVWNAIEGADPEISTERLTMLTADECRCADVSEVVEALAYLQDHRSLHNEQRGK